jgi:hypothetical protein
MTNKDEPKYPIIINKEILDENGITIRVFK